ncbi:hypothetical protein P43SY_010040 [Pythium insidiosum]|uniref:Protein kinase domain-containing protein n=1 Tax=Pythium insidiosum TaxID=114742 RepID=A0AAD5LYS3_PYTIN|nr:hypothetical protein P43SY_010040 [Pythium insidiosum]
MAAEDFAVIKTLRSAIYGHVALVRHRRSGELFAMKRMSLAHMAAQRAVSGPKVREDGDAELRILRRLSGNRVFTDGGDGDGDGDDRCGDLLQASWSAHPLWHADGSDIVPTHHHVLTLYTDFVDARSQSRCLILDYCPYGELYDQIQHAPSQSLSVDTTRRLFFQIATALTFIHAQGIAHRDLSLENVLIDARKQCRVADFGLAAERGRRCTGRVGKTFYMAPEVYGFDDAAGGDYDGLRADMWSLGVMLFIMVTGVPPFETPGEGDARFQVVQTAGVDALLRRWHLHERLPGDLRHLLSNLLCVEPHDRLTAEEVLAHAWLEDVAASAGFSGPEGTFERGLIAAEQVSDEPSAKTESDDSAGEPDEQMEATPADSASEQTPRRPRVRKRMKIVVEGDRDALLDARLQPPVLSHDSPFSRQIKSAPPLPLASPMVWPRVGVKAAFRRLLGSPPTDPCKASAAADADLALMDRDQLYEPDAEADDDERGDSAPASGLGDLISRRRPRVDSCSSCSSSSSTSSSSWLVTKQQMAT